MHKNIASNAAPGSPSRPTVVVAASAAGLRGRLAKLLRTDGLDVVASVENPNQLLNDDSPPGVLVLVLDTADGPTAARRLRRTLPDTRIVVVGPSGDTRPAVRGLRRSEVDAVVDGDRVGTALVPTVRAVLAEQVVYPRGERRHVDVILSHRERQVLSLVVSGCTNGEIAETLFLSTSTVKSHLTSAFSKLSVGSRSEATALLLDPDEPIGRAVLGRFGPSVEPPQREVPMETT